MLLSVTAEVLVEFCVLLETESVCTIGELEVGFNVEHETV